MMLLIGMAFGASVTLYLRRRAIAAAYIEGQRAGLKQARELVKDKCDSPLYLAPDGRLSEGLIRARASHDTYLELGTLINRVGR